MRAHYYAVIMAGGGGTRLWPLSRANRPKQMLRLNGEESLFQMAVNRLKGLFDPDHIYVVTVADQAVLLQQQSPEIPVENYLIEPMPRGTASVVGFAAVAIRQRDPQGVMAILTADHFIQNTGLFQELLRSAYSVAQDGYLVTLGIQPTFAATGYGYVQRGELLGAYEGHDYYAVLRFKEKPKEEQAREFLANGDHDWNSGMFIWRVDRILAEFQRQMPELMRGLEEIAAAWADPQRSAVIQSVWPGIKTQTIDYGIMENAERVAMLPARGLGWNDVGSWDSLFEVLPTDENGNIILGARHIGLNTSNSLICAENPDRMIVTIGASDLVIVDTGNAILVCPRTEAQKVRDLVNALKSAGETEYL
ncbi:MAG TPA: mannose-1-phosphate guanylyltransferase [Anaerolineaceae bacterium]